MTMDGQSEHTLSNSLGHLAKHLTAIVSFAAKFERTATSLKLAIAAVVVVLAICFCKNTDNEAI